jgi:hypothetical protein
MQRAYSEDLKEIVEKRFGVRVFGSRIFPLARELHGSVTNLIPG